MTLYNYSSKDILEIDLQTGLITDASITNSDLDNLCSKNILWNKTELRDSNCNDASFSVSELTECNFYRSSFINTQFSDCRFNNDTMHSLSLIKVKFINSKIRNVLFDSCTMQRAEFTKDIIETSTIKDVEGIYSDFSNTVFINCFFELTYGNGMNGFSSAVFDNCLFYRCRFLGNPLRGAKTNNCTFASCEGEITDDIEADCCYGLPAIRQQTYLELKNYDAAMNLIKEVLND